MTTSMRLFLFAGCSGIFLATFAVQVLPGVPVLYLGGLGLMGAGALGCVLASLPRLLNPQKPRFSDLHQPQARRIVPGRSANANTHPVSQRSGKRIGR